MADGSRYRVAAAGALPVGLIVGPNAAVLAERAGIPSSPYLRGHDHAHAFACSAATNALLGTREVAGFEAAAPNSGVLSLGAREAD
jgi:hypothetical protein